MQTDNQAIGQIQGKDRNGRMGPTWTYRENTCTWSKDLGFAHEIDTVDGIRAVTILKTRMKILVSEEGQTVMVEFKYNMKY